MSIVRVINAAGDAARLDGRALPVISTDRKTVDLLVAAIAGEIGCRASDLIGPDGIAMLDGVRFEAVR